MAIAYSYPTGIPELQDLLVGTEITEQGGEGTPRTRTFTIGSIVDLANGGVVGPEGPQGPIGAQGIQGIAGTAGAVGPAGLEWRGAWAPMTSYVEDDAVGWDGASWFCILASAESTVPSLDPTHWALLASRGAQGFTGPQGPTGPQGASGGTGTQTSGTLEIENVSPYQILSYDLNTIVTTGASDKVVLPSSAPVGKIVYVFARTNFSNFTVRGNQAGSALISTGGVSTQTSSITVRPNESYLFTSLGGGFWKSEAIGPSLQQVFDAGKTMTIGNFTAAVFDLAPGLSIKNTSSLSETTVETTKITFTKNSLGLKTTNVFQAITPTSNRTIYFPDADGTIALTSDLPPAKYKVYTALLKRTGATVEPPIVLENTIGTITFSYENQGVYQLNSPGLFTLDKTTVFVTNQPNGSFAVVLNASRISSEAIVLIQTTDAGTTDNNWSYPVSIEIRVYN